MIKVAFCTVPHTGGIYSIYKRLRESLSPLGIDVRCVYVGDEHKRWYGFDASLADDGCVHIAEFESDIKRSAAAFVQWLQEEKIDIVLPMSSMVCLSAVPYFPEQVKTVTRCVGITPFTYRLATAWPALTSKVVFTSLRQKNDLLRNYSISKGHLFHIPNAVDTDRFKAGVSRSDGPLNIGFVDRLDDREKNVFQIPRLLKALDGDCIPYRVIIVGSGPDEPRLRTLLSPWLAAGKVNLKPALPLSSMPEIYRNLDVLVKLSPAEGFPSTVIEAMSSSVLPVCYRIKGVTDWIVENGREGFVVPIDDITAIKNHLVALYRDPETRIAMAENARCRVLRDFNLDGFCGRWAQLFQLVSDTAPPIRDKASWDDFKICSVWTPSFLREKIIRRIPRSWRHYLRVFQEKHFS